MIKPLLATLIKLRYYLPKLLTFAVMLFIVTFTLGFAHEEPAVTFLTIWPTARSVALGAQ